MSNHLFGTAPDWYHNAVIHHNFSYSNKWDAYAAGYHMAGEILTKKVIDEANNRDTLVYPIIFLYRHYFELRLKEIIEHGSLFLDEPFKIPGHHDLMIIWADAKKVILKIWPDSSAKTLKDIDSIMIDFINIDKTSDAFRYPVKKNGDPNLDGFEMINIQRFADKVTLIIADLEGMSMSIRVYQDHKDEMTSEYQSYLENYL